MPPLFKGTRQTRFDFLELNSFSFCLTIENGVDDVDVYIT